MFAILAFEKLRNSVWHFKSLRHRHYLIHSMVNFRLELIFLHGWRKSHVFSIGECSTLSALSTAARLLSMMTILDTAERNDHVKYKFAGSEPPKRFTSTPPGTNRANQSKLTKSNSYLKAWRQHNNTEKKIFQIWSLFFDLFDFFVL